MPKKRRGSGLSRPKKGRHVRKSTSSNDENPTPADGAHPTPSETSTSDSEASTSSTISKNPSRSKAPALKGVGHQQLGDVRDQVDDGTSSPETSVHRSRSPHRAGPSTSHRAETPTATSTSGTSTPDPTPPQSPGRCRTPTSTEIAIPTRRSSRLRTPNPKYSSEMPPPSRTPTPVKKTAKSNTIPHTAMDISSTPTTPIPTTPIPTTPRIDNTSIPHTAMDISSTPTTPIPTTPIPTTSRIDNTSTCNPPIFTQLSILTSDNNTVIQPPTPTTPSTPAIPYTITPKRLFTDTASTTPTRSSTTALHITAPATFILKAPLPPKKSVPSTPTPSPSISIQHISVSPQSSPDSPNLPGIILQVVADVHVSAVDAPLVPPVAIEDNQHPADDVEEPLPPAIVNQDNADAIEVVEEEEDDEEEQIVILSPVMVNVLDANAEAEAEPLPPAIANHDNLDAIEVVEEEDDDEEEQIVILSPVVPNVPDANAEAEAELAALRDALEHERDRARQIPTYLRAATRANVVPFDLGELDGTCPYCAARYFRAEVNTRNVYSKCCLSGKIRLDAIRQAPAPLTALFSGGDVRSRNFKRAVLQYNYAFQFASSEANLRNFPTAGPYVYAIQGKVHHHLSDVNVNRGNPRLGPVYFLDPEAAVQQRLDNDVRNILVADVLAEIGILLQESNPFVAGYRHLREVYNAQPHVIGQPRPHVLLAFMNVRGQEYDLPMINEVAAVYRANEEMPPLPHLRVFAREGHTPLKTIEQDSPHVDPLTFPLLFPFGEPGWTFYALYAGRRITALEYYAHRLAYRDACRTFFNGGRLTQQYIVYAYIKIEANRIKFILQNQDRLRAEEYVGLADYLHNHAEEENMHVGRMVILPSTFVGSARSQQQRFQDAMAVVSRFGNPSLFITMTCNPQWPEIQRVIQAGGQPNDHPMLLARVFKAKLEEFVRDILKNHVFGVPVAQLHVIEFQKRGLPHAHILTILRQRDKLMDSLKIDQLISAEIPDPVTEPELYQLVAQHMVHGPCGALNPRSPCMNEDGRCAKTYPRAHLEDTSVDQHGRVSYRRRANERRVQIRRGAQNMMELDNGWIVPYNAFALLKYRCHINVEACATAYTVKYLYKYFFKNPDQALVRVQHVDGDVLEYDEVESFLNGRYMSPPEAAWHINRFPMHDNTHTVYRLPVHLPGRQYVRFEAGHEAEALEWNERTQLTAWFQLNGEDAEALGLLYTEIPNHYVWNARERLWRRRQRGGDKLVVRMHSVSFRNGDLYYLRLLLLHVRAVTSFEQVRTVDGVVCANFKEACRLRNLLADDTEWRRCLEEAVERQMPYQIRQLFAYILIFCEVSDPLALWVEFRDGFVDDFARQGGLEPAEMDRRALQDINNTLMIHGKRATDFGLPFLGPVEYVGAGDQIDVNAENAIGANMRDALNADQREIFDAVIAAIVDDNPDADRLFYVDGPGGCGKTYLYNAIASTLLGRGDTVLPVAFTGLAASLLKRGRTLHSRFKLPVPILENSTSGLRPNSADGQTAIAAKLIILDEASMVTRQALHLIDITLRDLCQNHRPFGGKTILVGGDFRQCLPIVRHGGRNDVVDACLKSGALWPRFTQFRLRTNVRAQGDQDGFADFLLQLGNDDLPHLDAPHRACIALPETCVVNSVQALIDACFEGQFTPGAHQGLNRAILTPLNDSCHVINDRIQRSLPGETKTYYSADSMLLTGDEQDEQLMAANWGVEILNGLCPSGMPPHRLILKAGNVVMLLRNLNVKKNLCNGTRLVIRLLARNYIEAQRLDERGIPTGETVFIPRIDCTPADSVLPFTLKRRQFPVRLSYCMTINKAQGQTLDTVGIYLPTTVFSHGQLYVAFSRARAANRVFVYVEDTAMQGNLVAGSDIAYTKNIVFPEIL